MTMHWSSDLVGLPWMDRGRTRSGVDCWGLLRLAYGEHLGIDLADYGSGYSTVAERQEIASLFGENLGRWPWQPVSGSPVEFDMLVFRRAGLDSHVGVVTNPRRGVMLHISARRESCLECYRNGRWAPRLSGVYRHVDHV